MLLLTKDVRPWFFDARGRAQLHVGQEPLVPLDQGGSLHSTQHVLEARSTDVRTRRAGGHPPRGTFVPRLFFSLASRTPSSRRFRLRFACVVLRSRTWSNAILARAFASAASATTTCDARDAWRRAREAKARGDREKGTRRIRTATRRQRMEGTRPSTRRFGRLANASHVVAKDRSQGVVAGSRVGRRETRDEGCGRDRNDVWSRWRRRWQW
mmetsp:Transcript_3250/g.20202  ORF Transcript_3250/g.20202 Transcript_3250/m.20202 type:complete len:212 (-) Transcript_3250:4040-4675(-)